MVLWGSTELSESMVIFFFQIRLGGMRSCVVDLTEPVQMCHVCILALKVFPTGSLDCSKFLQEMPQP